jgi:hypothetical protein
LATIKKGVISKMDSAVKNIVSEERREEELKKVNKMKVILNNLKKKTGKGRIQLQRVEIMKKYIKTITKEWSKGNIVPELSLVSGKKSNMQPLAPKGEEESQNEFDKRERNWINRKERESSPERRMNPNESFVIKAAEDSDKLIPKNMDKNEIINELKKRNLPHSSDSISYLRKELENDINEKLVKRIINNDVPIELKTDTFNKLDNSRKKQVLKNALLDKGVSKEEADKIVSKFIKDDGEIVKSIASTNTSNIPIRSQNQNQAEIIVRTTENNEPYVLINGRPYTGTTAEQSIDIMRNATGTDPKSNKQKVLQFHISSNPIDLGEARRNLLDEIKEPRKSRPALKKKKKKKKKKKDGKPTLDEARFLKRKQINKRKEEFVKKLAAPRAEIKKAAEIKKTAEIKKAAEIKKTAEIKSPNPFKDPSRNMHGGKRKIKRQRQTQKRKLKKNHRRTYRKK